MASKFALVIANTEYQDASFAKLTGLGKTSEEFARSQACCRSANDGIIERSPLVFRSLFRLIYMREDVFLRGFEDQ